MPAFYRRGLPDHLRPNLEDMKAKVNITLIGAIAIPNSPVKISAKPSSDLENSINSLHVKNATVIIIAAMTGTNIINKVSVVK